MRVAVLPSTAQEAAFVAHALRSAHVERGVAWAEMAVVARSGAQVTALRRALTGASVPVSVLGSDVPLREEPAVRPLLDAMRVCVGTETLDAATAARLACSPLGGLDTVGLRRVRRALRTHELAQGGGRTSDALLVEALGSDAAADVAGRASGRAPGPGPRGGSPGGRGGGRRRADRPVGAVERGGAGRAVAPLRARRGRGGGAGRP